MKTENPQNDGPLPAHGRNRTVLFVIGFGLLWMTGIAISTVAFREQFEWWRPAIAAGVGVVFFGVWICAWRAKQKCSGG